MSQSGRPTISIYDYPEHLNPFNEEITNSHPEVYREGKSKDSKHKFWTFGRSRKKRSNSFSIKSTWNGLFGKRKEAPEMQQKRSTITTVSSTYKREPTTKPVAPPRISRDQQEFDEALGTLARRRKYTLDNSSRYSSSLTVNGDPARIYDGSPHDTTTSIMGDLTPKPPARRFGQVSPKPTDKLPSLDFDGTAPKENGTTTQCEKTQERTPVPPLRRFGNRSSQRVSASTLNPEGEFNPSGDVTLCDENENVPDDYVFKRCSQDTVRMSNLSLNSCISVGSTVSTYGRKKRRAPQPPRRIEPMKTTEENVAKNTPENSNVELQIVESVDIARVTENIDEMTKKSKELDDLASSEQEDKLVKPTDDTENTEDATMKDSETGSIENISLNMQKKPIANLAESEQSGNQISEETQESCKTESEETMKKEIDNVEIEYRRTSQENLEIIKDVDQVNSLLELDEVCLRRKDSSGTLSRSDSFSVKEEIEKIERQIKALESKNASKDLSDEVNPDDLTTNTRLSIQANRRHFFQNMVDNEDGKDAIKIEFKELPREQKDIHVIRLTDPPVPVVAPREPVKVIELHISEPIRQKPEMIEDVNPIPKPRRHSALNLNGSQTHASTPPEKRKSLEPTRGRSF